MNAKRFLKILIAAAVAVCAVLIFTLKRTGENETVQTVSQPAAETVVFEEVPEGPQKEEPAVPTYESDEQELANIVGGKNISILGDSISTYCVGKDSWSNNPEYNSTIFQNDVYYYSQSFLDSVDSTYWKRIIDRFDLNLVVNNSYSGGHMVDCTWGNAGFIRAENLYADVDGKNPKGTKPDIVIIYLGTNDFDFNKHLGTTDDINPENYLVDENGKFTYDSHVKSVSDAFGYTIAKINYLYDTPDIFVATILPNGAVPDNPFGQRRKDYNTMIRSLPEIFDNVGVTDFDMDTPITPDNYYLYCCDGNLHPNDEGMALLSEAFRNAFVRYYLGREPVKETAPDIPEP